MITWSMSQISKTVPVIQNLTRYQIFLTWVFLLQIHCYIPQDIYGNFSLNLQKIVLADPAFGFHSTIQCEYCL